VEVRVFSTAPEQPVVPGYFIPPGVVGGALARGIVAIDGGPLQQRR
jgi:hypothetical protein